MLGDNFINEVNVGRRIEFIVLESAEKTIRYTSSSSEIIFEPLLQDDRLQSQPVMDLAKKELDWQLYTLLEEGVVETMAYCKGII